MNELEDLYAYLEHSRNMGFSPGDEALRQTEEKEDEIIKERVLPAIAQEIAPKLSRIKRDLTLVVEYHPGEPLRVAVSRETKIDDLRSAKTKTLTPEPIAPRPIVVDPKPPYPTPGPGQKTKNPTKGLRVTFGDGTEFWMPTAVETYMAAIKYIGYDRVAKVGIMHGGYNIVSRSQRPTQEGRVWQHESDGWHIYSNISNETKIDDLKRIAQYYGIKLTIEEVKPK